ncbi:MAG TPA: tetratricopeptide repeat protein [Nordella sp.]|nr:tetratricopeptide repeat protein [Nordella sp.]
MRHLRSILFLGLVLTAATPVFAVDTPTTKTAPDLTAIRALIASKDFKGAVTDLSAMVDGGVQNPDVYNLLGYSLRESGDLKTALTFYQKALDFDPNHKGALEYSGELYVKIGDLVKARDNEARLEKLCPQGCEELADLRDAIAQAVKTN